MNKLDIAILNRDYEAIIEEISDDYIDNDDYLSWFLKAYFVLKDYDSEIELIRKILKNKESYALYNYLIASLIHELDFYQIKSFIKKSKLLNSNEIKMIFDGDYSFITCISKLDDTDLITSICLMIFVNDVFNNYDLDSITKDDCAIVFYELLDNLYSNGINEEYLESLKFIGLSIF